MYKFYITNPILHQRRSEWCPTIYMNAYLMLVLLLILKAGSLAPKNDYLKKAGLVTKS